MNLQVVIPQGHQQPARCFHHQGTVDWRQAQLSWINCKAFGGGGLVGGCRCLEPVGLGEQPLLSLICAQATEVGDTAGITADVEITALHWLPVVGAETLHPSILIPHWPVQQELAQFGGAELGTGSATDAMAFEFSEKREWCWVAAAKAQPLLEMGLKAGR